MFDCILSLVGKSTPFCITVETTGQFFCAAQFKPTDCIKYSRNESSASFCWAACKPSMKHCSNHIHPWHVNGLFWASKPLLFSTQWMMWMEVPTYSSIIQFLEYGCVCGMQIHQEIITHPTYPHMAWLKKQQQHKISNCSGALLPQVWPILRYCTICYNFGGGEPPFGGTLEPLLWSQDIYIYHYISI